MKVSAHGIGEVLNGTLQVTPGCAQASAYQDPVTGQWVSLATDGWGNGGVFGQCPNANPGVLIDDSDLNAYQGTLQAQLAFQRLAREYGTPQLAQESKSGTNWGVLPSVIPGDANLQLPVVPWLLLAVGAVVVVAVSKK